MANSIKDQEAILAKLNIYELNPMQLEAIEVIKGFNNIILLSPTGTGKTAAFLIPMIDRILRSQEKNEEIPDRPFKDWQDSNFILILEILNIS